jgi:hypothetical protein
MTKRTTPYAKLKFGNFINNSELKFELRIKDILDTFIKDNPSISSYSIDPSDRSISVELSIGYDYEGRESFIAFGIRELKHMIKHIELTK